MTHKFGGYVHAPSLMLLSQACLPLIYAFGHPPYHVGSSLYRPDFRDVDVRLILWDEEFATLFPGHERVSGTTHARWSVMSSSISLYLSQASGLPVDFQFQQMTEANERYPQGPTGERHPLGIFPSTDPT